VDGLRIPVLRVLNEKYHEERDDGRARVDDQLPRVGKLKQWPSHTPDQDYQERQSKGANAARNLGNILGKPTEQVIHG
jgi:hypothetical protein